MADDYNYEYLGDTSGFDYSPTVDANPPSYTPITDADSSGGYIPSSDLFPTTYSSPEFQDLTGYNPNFDLANVSADLPYGSDLPVYSVGDGSKPAPVATVPQVPAATKPADWPARMTGA
jgi:hypothetical protein